MPEGLTAETFRQIRELGFRATAWNPTVPMAEIPLTRCREARRVMVDQGVNLVEFGVYHSNLIHPDPAVRRHHTSNLTQALQVSRALECPTVICAPGGLNPQGVWWPHPENHGPQARARLVESLKRLASTAGSEGVTLALECHTTTTLKDAATARAIADEVGSPALKIHLDPVNWITFDTIFSSGEAIDAMFEVLGPRLAPTMHSKGVTFENRFVLHVSETVTGAADDVLDHRAVLRNLARQAGERHLVFEHLPLDAVPAARQYVLRLAAELGVLVN